MPDFQPDPAESANAALWGWVHSLLFSYAVIAEEPLDSLSGAILGALSPDSFGPMMNPDGSPNVLTSLPAYHARSSDFVLDVAGWQIAVVGVEAPGRDASALLWWIQGDANEMQRFHGRVLEVDVFSVVRALPATPCVVMKGGVAENTYHLDNVLELSQRGKLPAVRNHELGRRLASWPISQITF